MQGPGHKAVFDDSKLHFDILPPQPTDFPTNIKLGRYHLISRNQPSQTPTNTATEDGFHYRLNHPLGEWVIQEALSTPTPVQKLVFEPNKNAAKITMVETLRGNSGVMILQKLTIKSFEVQEYLLFSGFTDTGQSLDQETCEKLMITFATVQSDSMDIPNTTIQHVRAQAHRHVEATIAQSLETNNAHFIEARDKLDRWAEDMILAAENALKDTKDKIKVAQRQARVATTLEEQHASQQQIQKLEK